MLTPPLLTRRQCEFWGGLPEKEKETSEIKRKVQKMKESFNTTATKITIEGQLLGFVACGLAEHLELIGHVVHVKLLGHWLELHLLIVKLASWELLLLLLKHLGHQWLCLRLLHQWQLLMLRLLLEQQELLLLLLDIKLRWLLRV